MISFQFQNKIHILIVNLLFYILLVNAIHFFITVEKKLHRLMPNFLSFSTKNKKKIMKSIFKVILPDWDSLWSSSIWWRSSCSNPLFNQCRELIWFSLRLQNLLGSRMFSTEKANFRHEFLSVFGVVGGIVRVKSTGHTC